MFNKIIPFLQKPMPYEAGSANLWNDKHISKKMLEAHLNPAYDGATRNFEFIDRSVRWISNTFPSGKYPDLLDLGCGPGIYAERFHQKNYHVTGIDFSERSIKYAMASAASKDFNIKYNCQDYLTLSYDRQFDIATMIYCDFGVLSDENRKVLLKKIYRALKPHGILVFDVFTPGNYQNRAESGTWEYCQNGFYSDKPYINIASFHRYDDCCTFLEQYIIITNDDIKCHNIWNHGFKIEELRSELTAAGFGRIDFFADVSGARYHKNSHTICVTAHKEL